jgi:CubicO group peptidase (beta-lactamase class C family)
MIGGMTMIHGRVATGFEAVRDVFQANFDIGAEDGAAFAAYHRGLQVVDLWGGVADTTTGKLWSENTMVLTYSTTKGATAMCANRLIEQGLLDVDAPVARYWPEFARAGKDAVTVADLLAHRAGLAWIDGTMSFDDALAWEPVIEALARQSPAWEPGTDHGYHAVTFGYLVGEVVRRISGRTIGTYFDEEIAGPLGADWYIGLPTALESRVARLVPFESGPDGNPFDGLGALDGGSGDDPVMADLLAQLAPYLGPDGALTRALGAPGGAFSSPDAWQDPRLHAAEIPAANGICDARSVARVYGACVSDVARAAGGTFRVLSPGQLDTALVQQTAGPDRVLVGMDIQWGLGFMLNVGAIALAGLGGPRSFGHFGMGGSVGWADPDLELGLGYVMNRMSLGATGDSRSADLIHATLAAVGGA